MSKTDKNVPVDTGEGPEVHVEEEPVEESALDTSPVVEEVRENKTAADRMKARLKEFRGNGEIKYPLERPLRSGVKEIKTLRLNFNQLTPMHIIEAETRWSMEFGGGANISPSHATSYRLIIASMAAGLPVEDLLNGQTGLTYRDTIGLSNVVLSFLMQLD